MGPYHTWTRNSLNASQWACATTKPGSGWWLATCSSPVITPRCRNKCIAIAICYAFMIFYDLLWSFMIFYDLLCVSLESLVFLCIPWLFLMFLGYSMLCTAGALLRRSCARATPSPECGPQMDLWNLCSSSWRRPLAKLSNAPKHQVAPGTSIGYWTQKLSLSFSLSLSLMSTHTRTLYIYKYIYINI